MLNSPQRVTATALDSAVQVDWDHVSGADGYILYFYHSAVPDKCVKTRHAQGTSKIILGLQNGTEYLVGVKAFCYSNGKELVGKLSDPVAFIPISHKLKAQNVVLLQKDEQCQLRWERENTIPPVQFCSSDEAVARVSETGLITAFSDGVADVTLTAADKESFLTSVAVGRDRFQKDPSARILLCGDVMCSVNQQRRASRHSHDYAADFDDLRQLIHSADYSIAVLETTCCDRFPYEYEQKRTDSNSPNCNSPSTFLDALKGCGFRALVTANNHNCDTGLSGLKDTVDQISCRGMLNLGTLDHAAQLVELNGFAVGLIAVNSTSNGREGDIPPSQIGSYDPDRFKSLVLSLRAKGAEYIIAYQHWGKMNSIIVQNQQINSASYMAECGADLIIGSHPHVLQRVSTIHTSDGREVPCFFSLGNLISSMRELHENRESAIVDLTLRRSSENGITADISCIPTLCENTAHGYRVSTLCHNLTLAQRTALQNITHILGNAVPLSGTPRFLLQGSDVLRQVFSTIGYPYDNTALILSPLSLMSEVGNLPRTLERNARNNMDIHKTFREHLQNSHADYVVIDLYALAGLSCYQQGDSYYTATQSFLASAFYQQNKQTLQKVSPPYSDHIWKTVLKKYAALLSSLYTPDRIILVRLSFSEMCAKHDQLRNGKKRISLNNRLRACEDYLIALLHPVTIDVSAHYFADGDNNQITAFEPLFYDDVREKICSVVQHNTHGSFCLDIPNPEIWIQRVLRYYDNMTARAYQKFLLDRRYVADRVIECSSKEFTAENARYLLELRKKEITNPEDAQAVLADKYGAKDVLAVIRAMTVLEAGIEHCCHDDIRIVFDKNLLLKKKLARELIKIYPYANAENCEEIFQLRNNSAALQAYKENHMPAIVDIWGSCVSRETVNRNPCSIHVNKYIFKQPILLFEEPDIPFDSTLGKAAFCDNAWRRRTIQEAFQHKGKDILNASGSPWLIIDLYDLICSMKKYGPHLFEVDDFVLRTKFYQSIASECSDTYLFQEMEDSELEERLTRFCSFIQKRYAQNVILIRLDLKNEYLSLDKELCPLPDKDGSYTKKCGFLKKYEEKFIEYTSCHVVDIARNYYADDRFPLGGAHIVHYESSFYMKCCSEITRILQDNAK